ncbi:DUF5372 family protein [Frankia sp. CiP3]|uniref:DUF5372 family protein n=1 Tax=Frankia sp. CiP3 TaxID=2880971 RepID=UPI001EF66707|nr:DUF5372 family protein [Frankia sp. CiP3]
MGGCAGLASRRSRHTAESDSRSSKSLVSDSLVVVHPFHALSGQCLDVLFSKRWAGEMLFVCVRPGSGQVTLPAAWTDRGSGAEQGRLSVDGLAALGAVTRALKVVDGGE